MTHEKLPKGYIKLESVHLEKDKHHKRKINLTAMIIAVALVMIGQLAHPFDEAATVLLGKAWVLIALLGVLFAFMVAHELTHALLMRLISHVKPKIAVKGLYCYAGSPAYFDRGSYMKVCLLPSIIWGAVLLVLYFVLPDDWFWLIHLVQIANFAGSAGDYYSAAVILKMKKKTILVQDLGDGMKLFVPERE